MTGWKLRRSTATGTTSALHTLGARVLEPGQHLLLTNSNAGGPYSGAVIGDETYGTGITDNGGVALLLPDETTVDQVGMSTGSAYFEGSPLAPMSDNTEQSYERKPGGASGSCYDTDHNAADWNAHGDTSDPQNLSAPLTFCDGVATQTPVPSATPTETLVTLTATWTPTDTLLPSSPTATITPSQTPNLPPLAVVINELAWSGTQADANDEWIELYNNTDATIDLTGWTLEAEDGTPHIALNGTISPNGFYLLERTADTTIQDLGADLLYTGALENAGESLRLHDPADNLIDTANGAGGAWWAGTTSPRCSMERRDPSSADVDANWGTNDGMQVNGLDAAGNPICGTPRQANSAGLSPTATPTVTLTQTFVPPSATSTATSTPTPTGPTVTGTPVSPSSTASVTPSHTPSIPPLAVVINEVAWSGTQADANDEWIELLNNTSAAVDLTGWTLEAEDGTPRVTLNGTIGSNAFYLLERTADTTIQDISADLIFAGALENSGESLILRDAAGSVIDSANGAGGDWAAGSTSSRCSMERRHPSSADDALNWVTNDGLHMNGLDADSNRICGTPRQVNSATLATTATTTATLTETLAPASPSSTATSTAPSPTYTATLTGTPAPQGVFINEFMPDPASDWNADGVADERDEWIELYNGNSFDVDLSQWQLDDVGDRKPARLKPGAGSKPYVFPEGAQVGAHGYLIVYGKVSGVQLNNTNDDVRLLHPDSSIADQMSYTSSKPDRAWARIPDGAPFFSRDCPPTPGAPNCSIVPTPTITLTPSVTPTPFPNGIVVNEFLPAPYKDWNADGVLDSDDEWIELFNRSNRAVDVSGWKLDDARSGSSPFVLPADTLLKPHTFRVFFASETHIGLNNDGDRVRLLHPDNTVADQTAYEPVATNKSYGRYPDGAHDWVTHCIPSPAQANCSIRILPTETPAFNLTSIADARKLPPGSTVSVMGSVIAHPCELDEYAHEMVLSDGEAAIDVYLEFPEQLSCLIPRNEQLVVTGVIGDHAGLTTLYPSSNRAITRHYAAPREIAAWYVHTGDISEETESMLLMIQGTVANGRNGDEIWVDDGSGAVEVYADPASGASFAGITHGSTVRITGVGYQNNSRTLPHEGYYLRPRAPDDVMVLDLAERRIQTPRPRRVTGGNDLGAVSIQAVRSTQTQNVITVSGSVTVPPGVIDAHDFWIQAADGGVRVSVAASAGQLPELHLSDLVTVRGRVVSAFGARQVNVEQPDSIRVSGAGKAVTPRVLATGAIDFSQEGLLVKTVGMVMQVQGREVYLDDGTGEVLAYIDANTHIRYPRLQRGDAMRVIGVVSRFRGRVEILPRFQEDVAFGGALLPVAGAFVSDTTQFIVRGRTSETAAQPGQLRATAFARRGQVERYTASTRSDSVTPGFNVIDLIALVLLTGSLGAGMLSLRVYIRTRRQ